MGELVLLGVSPVTTWYGHSYDDDAPGSVTIQGGAANRTAALNDNSDTTYLNTVAQTNGVFHIDWSQDLSAIPAGAIIEKVRAEMRWARASGASDQIVPYVFFLDPAQPHDVIVASLQNNAYDFTSNQTADGVIRDYITPWVYNSANGSGPTFASLLTGHAGYKAWLGVIRNASPQSANHKIVKMAVRVSYNEAPVATISAPTGTIGNARPAVVWAYSDPESDPQQAYQVRIFTATQYGAAGFDPWATGLTGAAIPVWDSNKVYSSATSVTPTATLLNGVTYRAYVRVWQPDVQGVEAHNVTTYSTFSISLSGSQAPVLTVTADPTNARTLLDFQGFANLLPGEDASFEGGTIGHWSNGGTDVSGSNTTSIAVDGTHSLLLTKSSTGASTWGTIAIEGVVPGKSYVAAGYVRAVTTGRLVTMVIDWYTEANAFISTSSLMSVNDVAGSWTGIGGTATAPATAAIALIRFAYAGPPAAGEVHAIDAVNLIPAGTAYGFAPGFGNPAGSFTASLDYAIERSDDGGVTWKDIRFSPYDGHYQTDNQHVAIYDYEAPFGVACQYRARHLADDGAGNIVPSAYSTPQSVTLNVTKWWLKDPTNSALNIAVRVGALDYARAKPQAEGYPIGSSVAAVSHDGLKGASLTASITTLSKAEFDALEALLKSGDTLLLQNVLGQEWYVQPGDGIRYTMIKAGKTASETTPLRHAYKIDVPLLEVSVP